MSASLLSKRCPAPVIVPASQTIPDPQLLQPTRTSRRSIIGFISNKCYLYRGFLFCICGSFLMSLNAVIVKYTVGLEGQELSFFRFIDLFFINIPYLVYSRESPAGPGGSRFTLILRGVFGGLGIMFSYNAMKLIPIAEASLVSSTTPIFVTILARIFLKETCDVIHVLSIIVSMFGLVLLARIPKIMIDGNWERFEEFSYWKGFLFALISAMLGSCVIVFIRKLSSTVHVSVVIFYFSWTAVAITGIINYSMLDFRWPKCGSESLLILILAIFSFCGQLLVTRALRCEEAGPISVVRFAARVVFIFIWQTVIFNQPPDGYIIGAAILVTGSIICSTYRKHYKMKKKKLEMSENRVQKPLETAL